MSGVSVRAAREADLEAIAAIAIATGQHEEWAAANPAYIGHLMRHGRVAVAELGGTVAGFGAVQRLGTGPDAVTLLCDLFVDPRAHGKGCGRAMLTALWADASRRMAFSSLHSNAMPLYTSFGLDAWWPLLYLHGQPGRLSDADGWKVERGSADDVAQLEFGWTSVDRTADHRAWGARPGGSAVIVSARGEAVAAGTVITTGPARGIEHLALSPAVDDAAAGGVVLAVLGWLDAAEPGAAETGAAETGAAETGAAETGAAETGAAETGAAGGGAVGSDAAETGAAHVCLPGPHPAVRPLLAGGWKIREFDLFMATEPALLDPRRAVPSPGQA